MDHGFEFFEHTADIGFNVRAEDLETAFELAGKAFFSIMTDLDDIDLQKTEVFEIISEDKKALLYDFLDHLVFLKDVEKIVLKDFEIVIKKEKEELSLRCTARGQKFKKLTGSDIKAVTYNQMEIIDSEEGCQLKVVVDV